jgi:CMP-N,N'-diacetyllegionaminic acid synthase
MNNAIALIPARAGSKGVPNKNIRELGGKSLLAWSITAAKKAKFIERVIVSTDSKEYAGLAVELGAEVPFLRPTEISGDRSSDYDFIVHALNWFRDNELEPDLIAHIRPTTPFRDPLLIDTAIDIFRNNPQATALRSAHEMSESAYKSFEIAGTGQFKRLGSSNTALDAANNARQQYPATFQANGYVDVLSSRFIRSHGLIHGDWVLPFITPLVVEVDTEEDFGLLEYQLAHNPGLYKILFS